MSFFRNYDPSQVTFSFNQINVTGYQDGTFIEVERNEDAFSSHVGSTGDVARVKNLNKTGKFTLTLMAQAPSNDFLMSEAENDEMFGLNYGPIMLKDNNGTMICRAHEAWITKVPKVERGKEAGPCEWVFECAELYIWAGGNVL